MKAIVLAGGYGTRLKPLTDDCPKPLLKIAGIPMLDYTVAQLYAYGITDITYTLSYRANDIIHFCSGYRELRQSYVIERHPLGTCGGVKAASGGAGDTFIVLSGDALDDIDLSALLVTHYAADALVTMAVTEADNPSLYGVVGLDGAKVTGFVEKPEDGRYGNLINCGVYVVDRRALRYAPDDEPFDFSRDLFPVLLEKGRLAAYRHPGRWSDIGDVGSYRRANFERAAGGYFARVAHPRVRPLAALRDANLYCGEGTVIEGSVYDSIVGDGVYIAPGVSVRGCVILDRTRVLRSYTNAVIGPGFAVLQDAAAGTAEIFPDTRQNFYENSSN